MKGVLIRDIRAIILAAGKGVRMNSDIPKVLHPLRGKPIILHVIDSLRGAGIDEIIIVVGYKGDMLIEVIGNSVDYVWQYEQLGTGHAVSQTEKALGDFSGSVLLACGDAPLIRSETFKRMIVESEKGDTKAVVLAMIQKKPDGYGRIIKDEKGHVKRIVEDKDASSEERQIIDVNTGTYIFEKDSLFSSLRILDKNNAQGEYYLTDAIEQISSSGYSVRSVTIDNPIEGSGINSKQELQMLEKYMVNNLNYFER